MPRINPDRLLADLRSLRVLRLLSVVPQMRRVIGAIGHAIPGMISVIGVLGLVFYISAVLATKLFWPMSDDPNDAGLSRKHIMESCAASLSHSPSVR